MDLGGEGFEAVGVDDYPAIAHRVGALSRGIGGGHLREDGLEVLRGVLEGGAGGRLEADRRAPGGDQVGRDLQGDARRGHREQVVQVGLGGRVPCEEYVPETSQLLLLPPRGPARLVCQVLLEFVELGDPLLEARVSREEPGDGVAADGRSEEEGIEG